MDAADADDLEGAQLCWFPKRRPVSLKDFSAPPEGRLKDFSAPQTSPGIFDVFEAPPEDVTQRQAVPSTAVVFDMASSDEGPMLDKAAACPTLPCLVGQGDGDPCSALPCLVGQGDGDPCNCDTTQIHDDSTHSLDLSCKQFQDDHTTVAPALPRLMWQDVDVEDTDITGFDFGGFAAPEVAAEVSSDHGQVSDASPNLGTQYGLLSLGGLGVETLDGSAAAAQFLPVLPFTPPDEGEAGSESRSVARPLGHDNSEGAGRPDEVSTASADAVVEGEPCALDVSDTKGVADTLGPQSDIHSLTPAVQESGQQAAAPRQVVDFHLAAKQLLPDVFGDLDDDAFPDDPLDDELADTGVAVDHLVDDSYDDELAAAAGFMDNEQFLAMYDSGQSAGSLRTQCGPSIHALAQYAPQVPVLDGGFSDGDFAPALQASRTQCGQLPQQYSQALDPHMQVSSTEGLAPEIQTSRTQCGQLPQSDQANTAQHAPQVQLSSLATLVALEQRFLSIDEGPLKDAFKAFIGPHRRYVLDLNARMLELGIAPETLGDALHAWQAQDTPPASAAKDAKDDKHEVATSRLKDFNSQTLLTPRTQFEPLPQSSSQSIPSRTQSGPLPLELGPSPLQAAKDGTHEAETTRLKDFNSEVDHCAPSPRTQCGPLPQPCARGQAADSLMPRDHLPPSNRRKGKGRGKSNKRPLNSHSLNVRDLTG